MLLESIFDVTSGEARAADETTAAWLALPGDQQWAWNALWDWLFTQVLHDHPATPFNYQTAAQWSARLACHGFREVTRDYLGIDQPLVPEFHVLLVFDRHEEDAHG